MRNEDNKKMAEAIIGSLHNIMGNMKKPVFLVSLILLLLTMMPQAAADVIQPCIIEPSNETDVYSNITIWATELTNPETITSALFEYSADGIDWITIGTDTNGTIESKATDRISYQWGIWTVNWTIDSLSEGWYYLRVNMTNTTHSGEDQVQVYVDPTPPIPVVVKPTLVDGLEAEVSGLVTFEANTTDENVVSMKLEFLQVPFLSTYYEKGIPKKDQHDYGPLKGHPEGSQEWKDDTSCGPTSAGASIWYWAKKYPDVFGDLIKEDGKELNQTELIYKLHEYFAPDGKAETVERKGRGNGVVDGFMEKGLRDWIKNHGGGLTVKLVKKEDFTFKRYKTELLECEDLLVSTNAHWMAGNSVNNKKNPDGTYDVDFMDPWTGKYTTVKMSKDGSFTKYGRPKDTMFVISPTPEKEKELAFWTPIGTDTYGADGWSVSWDTTGLTTCKYYLVRLTMTDANGRTGTDKIVVHICQKEVPALTPPGFLLLVLSLLGLGTIVLRKRYNR